MQRVFVLFIAAVIFTACPPKAAHSQESARIWQEFVSTLRKGEMTADKIRPYHESLRQPMMGFLTTMKEKASWKEWQATPEAHCVHNQVHYLIPLTFDGQQATYCFTFMIEGGQWYFQQLEAITIRLDQLSTLPVSKFPEVAEEQKAWIREEIFWSKHVYLFNVLSQEKGKEFVLNLFKDGAGYFVAARALVPFLPPPKAFILYLCWEQSNLRGNQVTLEKLDEDQATVRLAPAYFALYDRTAHLKQQISYEDYRQIFETIWQDRAHNDGWSLQITYKEGECVFHFRKT